MAEQGPEAAANTADIADESAVVLVGATVPKSSQPESAEHVLPDSAQDLDAAGIQSQSTVPSSQARQSDHLGDPQLVPVDVPRDGDCLYHSLLKADPHLATITGGSVQTMRQDTAALLWDAFRSNEDWATNFQGGVVYEDSGIPHEVQQWEWTHETATPGRWDSQIGDWAPWLLAEAYGIPVSIVQQDAAPVEFGPSGGTRITLVREGEHYLATLPADGRPLPDITHGRLRTPATQRPEHLLTAWQPHLQALHERYNSVLARLPKHEQDGLTRTTEAAHLTLLQAMQVAGTEVSAAYYSGLYSGLLRNELREAYLHLNEKLDGLQRDQGENVVAAVPPQSPAGRVDTVRSVRVPERRRGAVPVLSHFVAAAQRAEMSVLAAAERSSARVPVPAPYLSQDAAALAGFVAQMSPRDRAESIGWLLRHEARVQEKLQELAREFDGPRRVEDGRFVPAHVTHARREGRFDEAYVAGLRAELAGLDEQNAAEADGQVAARRADIEFELSLVPLREDQVRRRAEKQLVEYGLHTAVQSLADPFEADGFVAVVAGWPEAARVRALQWLGEYHGTVQERLTNLDRLGADGPVVETVTRSAEQEQAQAQRLRQELAQAQTGTHFQELLQGLTPEDRARVRVLLGEQIAALTPMLHRLAEPLVEARGLLLVAVAPGPDSVWDSLIAVAEAPIRARLGESSLGTQDGAVALTPAALRGFVADQLAAVGRTDPQRREKLRTEDSGFDKRWVLEQAAETLGLSLTLIEPGRADQVVGTGTGVPATVLILGNHVTATTTPVTQQSVDGASPHAADNRVGPVEALRARVAAWSLIDPSVSTENGQSSSGHSDGVDSLDGSSTKLDPYSEARTDVYLQGYAQMRDEFGVLALPGPDVRTLAGKLAQVAGGGFAGDPQQVLNHREIGVQLARIAAGVATPRGRGTAERDGLRSALNLLVLSAALVPVKADTGRAVPVVSRVRLVQVLRDVADDLSAGQNPMTAGEGSRSPLALIGYDQSRPVAERVARLALLNLDPAVAADVAGSDLFGLLLDSGLAGEALSSGTGMERPPGWRNNGISAVNRAVRAQVPTIASLLAVGQRTVDEVARHVGQHEQARAAVEQARRRLEGLGVDARSVVDRFTVDHDRAAARRRLDELTEMWRETTRDLSGRVSPVVSTTDYLRAMETTLASPLLGDWLILAPEVTTAEAASRFWNAVYAQSGQGILVESGHGLRQFLSAQIVDGAPVFVLEDVYVGSSKTFTLAHAARGLTDAGIVSGYLHSPEWKLANQYRNSDITVELSLLDKAGLINELLERGLRKDQHTAMMLLETSYDHEIEALFGQEYVVVEEAPDLTTAYLTSAMTEPSAAARLERFFMQRTDGGRKAAYQAAESGKLSAHGYSKSRVGPLALSERLDLRYGTDGWNRVLSDTLGHYGEISATNVDTTAAHIAGRIVDPMIVTLVEQVAVLAGRERTLATQWLWEKRLAAQNALLSGEAGESTPLRISDEMLLSLGRDPYFVGSPGVSPSAVYRPLRAEDLEATIVQKLVEQFALITRYGEERVAGHLHAALADHGTITGDNIPTAAVVIDRSIDGDLGVQIAGELQALPAEAQPRAVGWLTTYREQLANHTPAAQTADDALIALGLRSPKEDGESPARPESSRNTTSDEPVTQATASSSEIDPAVEDLKLRLDQWSPRRIPSDELESGSDSDSESRSDSSSIAQELGEQELGEQELGEQELGEQELSEQELSEQELSEQELSEQQLSDYELSEQQLSEQQLSDYELSEQELSEKDSDWPSSPQELSESETDLDSETSSQKPSESSAGPVVRLARLVDSADATWTEMVEAVRQMSPEHQRDAIVWLNNRRLEKQQRVNELTQQLGQRAEGLFDAAYEADLKQRIDGLKIKTARVEEALARTERTHPSLTDSGPRLIGHFISTWGPYEAASSLETNVQIMKAGMVSRLHSLGQLVNRANQESLDVPLRRELAREKSVDQALSGAVRLLLDERMHELLYAVDVDVAATVIQNESAQRRKRVVQWLDAHRRTVDERLRTLDSELDRRTVRADQEGGLDRLDADIQQLQQRINAVIAGGEQAGQSTAARLRRELSMADLRVESLQLRAEADTVSQLINTLFHAYISDRGRMLARPAPGPDSLWNAVIATASQQIRTTLGADYLGPRYLTATLYPEVVRKFVADKAQTHASAELVEQIRSGDVRPDASSVLELLAREFGLSLRVIERPYQQTHVGPEDGAPVWLVRQDNDFCAAISRDDTIRELDAQWTQLEEQFKAPGTRDDVTNAAFVELDTEITSLRDRISRATGEISTSDLDAMRGMLRTLGLLAGFQVNRVDMASLKQDLVAQRAAFDAAVATLREQGQGTEQAQVDDLMRKFDEVAQGKASLSTIVGRWVQALASSVRSCFTGMERTTTQNGVRIARRSAMSKYAKTHKKVRDMQKLVEDARQMQRKAGLQPAANWAGVGNLGQVSYVEPPEDGNMQGEAPTPSPRGSSIADRLRGLVAEAVPKRDQRLFALPGQTELRRAWQQRATAQPMDLEEEAEVYTISYSADALTTEQAAAVLQGQSISLGHVVTVGPNEELLPPESPVVVEIEGHVTFTAQGTIIRPGRQYQVVSVKREESVQQENQGPSGRTFIQLLEVGGVSAQ